MPPESTKRTESSTYYLTLPDAPQSQRGPVKAWEQELEILTYAPGAPEHNPMFLENRVYQGSSGRVYPLPFIDRIATEPGLKLWKAIHIENEYLRLMILGAEVARWSKCIDVESPTAIEFPLPPGSDPATIAVAVYAGERMVVDYDAARIQPAPPPAVATEPKAPKEIDSIEELYLTGLHLEQYRHATRKPELYWAEGLRRDPHDSRIRNAMGLWHLRRGEFEQAAEHFHAAIVRLTALNPNPRDGEPYYNLGLACRYQGPRKRSVRRVL